MEKEMFVRFLSESLRRLGMRVTETQFRKLGTSYTGLSLQDGVSAVYNVDKAYEEYQMGRPIRRICKEAAAVLRMPIDIRLGNIDFINSFDEAKSRLFIRVSNRNHNAEYLKSVPHVNVMDLSITFHLLIDDSSSLQQTAVTNEMMTSWNVDLETLCREAIISSEHLFQMELMKMSHVFGFQLSAPSEPMVLSNSSHMNGASALFYRDTFDKLNEQFKEGCYLIPSSIHEIIVIDSRDANASALIEILRANNNDRSIVKEEDVLSDTLYFLDHTGLRRYSDA